MATRSFKTNLNKHFLLLKYIGKLTKESKEILHFGGEASLDIQVDFYIL